MEIQNASTTSSKSNQLRNVNTVRWESWNVTTQPLSQPQHTREKGIITLESNPSRGTVLPAPHGKVTSVTKM